MVTSTSLRVRCLPRLVLVILVTCFCQINAKLMVNFFFQGSGFGWLFGHLRKTIDLARSRGDLNLFTIYYCVRLVIHMQWWFDLWVQGKSLLPIMHQWCHGNLRNSQDSPLLKKLPNWQEPKKLFAFLKILNMINLQTNTTKLVIMTLSNYHQKEIMIHQKKIPTFLNPSLYQNPFFSPFEPSSEVIMHCMECTQVKCTHPSNTPTCTLQLSSNITKVTHLSSYALNVFILQHLKMIPDHAVQKSQLCHFATSEFHKLDIYPEQIACFITNHANITLK